MKKGTLLNSLLKAAIVAAGTGAGMLLAKCFSVEEEPDETEEETVESDVIDVTITDDTSEEV